MYSWLGTVSVLVAWLGAWGLVYTGYQLARRRDVGTSAPNFAQVQKQLRWSVVALLGGGLAAFLSLEGALVDHDFTVSYVANNHSIHTPFPFNLASAWAALEGSIVLWGLVLAGYTAWVFRRVRRFPDRLGWGALVVLGLISVYFFGLMLTISNPFEVCIQAGTNSCLQSSPLPWANGVGPMNGAGPNPLLQNHILMTVHPPLLYLGYVGMSVPFAYAISALWFQVPGAEWLRQSHRTTLVAWGFLTLGIVIGGWWAYEVLSWGGYWAWDPVENASFLPWLIATAFIHSALVQKRRGMLQSWNFVLVIGVFALTILGTFLTRSGTIASVHSFTQSAIGPALLGFLAVVLVGSLSLFWVRGPTVASRSRLDRLVSREGAFLVNNLLLTVFAMVVLVGTLYPLFVDAFTGETIGVGRPFFDRFAVPLAFTLLLAMGIGPVLPWRAARLSLVWKKLHGPLQVGLAAGLVTALVTTQIGWVLVAVVISVFVIAVILRLAWEQAGRRSVRSNRNRWVELPRLVGSDPGFWGGQISHLGVALVALSISFSANLAQHAEVSMSVGDTVSFSGYELEYVSPFRTVRADRTSEGARILVSRDGNRVAEMEPRINFIGRTAIGTPAVANRLTEDLYLTLTSIDSDGIRLKLDTSPLQWLMWLGGLTVAGGGFVSLRARSVHRRIAVVAREPVQIGG